jgi:hypothetical protein
MPIPVGVSMHAVQAIQVAGIDVPVHHATIDVDEVVVDVIDPAAAPIPTSAPATPPGP